MENRRFSLGLFSNFISWICTLFTSILSVVCEWYLYTCVAGLTIGALGDLGLGLGLGRGVGFGFRTSV